MNLFKIWNCYILFPLLLHTILLRTTIYLITVLTGIKGFSYQVHNFFYRTISFSFAHIMQS